MRTLLTKLVAIVVSFLLLHSALTYAVTNSLYGNAVSENILAETRQKLSQVSVNVDTLVSTAVAAGNLICKDNGLLRLLDESSRISTPSIPFSEDPGFSKWYLDVAYPLKEKISAVQNAMLYQHNASIYLLDNNGVYYTDMSAGFWDITDSPFIDQVIQKRGYIVHSVPATNFSMFSEMKSHSLMIAYAIRKNYSDKIIGTILIALEFPSSLSDAFEPSADGQTMFLLDADGRIAVGGNALAQEIDWNTIALSNDGRPLRLTADSETCYAISSQNQRTGWQLVQLIPSSTLFAELDTLRHIILWLLLVLSVIEALFIFLIIRQAMRPLQNLSQLITRVGEGDFSLSAPVRGRDEIARISNSFNIMVRQIDQLVKSNHAQHQLREQAMLETLRAQINPHFLLNTLNDIKWLAIINGDPAVGTMLSTLGGLLETSLGRNSTFVTLDEEIRYTEKYIKLANLRFNNCLMMELDISPDAGALYIPVLILQPLIENVTRHGLREDADTLIRIRARVEGEMLVVLMRDNGNGIAPDKLSEIRATMNDFQSVPRKSIGVNNVHKRIVLTYGSQYGLTIDSIPNQGTTITMRFPARREREADLSQC